MKRMLRVAALLLLALPLLLAGLSACEKNEELPAPPRFASERVTENPFALQAFYAEPFTLAASSMPADPSAPALAATPPQARTLAYEHVIDIELSRALLLKRVEEIRAACREAAETCTLLDISVSSDERIPSAAIRMRIAPGGVDRLVDLTAAGGNIRSRTTHAEDLAEPIADTERQLSQLTTHRDRLAGLMKDKALTVDQLITTSRELSSVQTQLDQLGATRANLRRRVDTDLLTLNLTLPRREFRSEQTPVLDAMHSFGSEVRWALGQVVTFIANLLPWLIVLVPGLIAIRWFWRRTGRWLAQRERPVA